MPFESENLFKWHYNELLKTLIILSSTSDYQIETTGIGDLNVEMVEEFIWHYIESRNELVSLKLISEVQASQIDCISVIIN